MLDELKVVERIKSKIRFLDDCNRYKVVPTTCQARYKPPMDQNSEVIRTIKEATYKASCKIVTAAIAQERYKLLNRQNVLKEKTKELKVIAKDGLREEIDKMVEVKRERYRKGCKNTHTRRLRTLLIKEGRDLSINNNKTMNKGECYRKSTPKGESREPLFTPSPMQQGMSRHKFWTPTRAEWRRTLQE